MTTKLNGKANSSHNHSASQITSGTLPVTRGGTGVTSLAALKSALGINGVFPILKQIWTKKISVDKTYYYDPQGGYKSLMEIPSEILFNLNNLALIKITFNFPNINGCSMNFYLELTGGNITSTEYGCLIASSQKTTNGSILNQNVLIQINPITCAFNTDSFIYGKQLMYHARPETRQIPSVSITKNLQTNKYNPASININYIVTRDDSAGNKCTISGGAFINTIIYEFTI